MVRISEELRNIYASNPSGAFYMEAFTIDHPALPEKLHITNYRGGFKGNADGSPADFRFCPFEIKLPDKDTSGSQAIQITLANDEQDLIDEIELMARQPYAAATCRYRVYISTEIDASGAYEQQLKPAWRYDISSIVVNADVISMTASRENMHNRVWPRKQYRSDLFPGLDK